MALGFRALRYSANVAMAGLTAEEEKKVEVPGWALALNVALSLGFFIFMYKFVPLLAATKLKNAYPAFGNQIAFNVVDGVIRIALFLLFIWGISRWPDIRRVFQYHGAEHKTVFAFESHDPLTIQNAQSYSTFHPRCGTSFLMTVMLIAMVIYMLVPATTFWARFAFRIALLPVIAGVSYELIRFAAKHGVFAVRDSYQAGPVAAAHHYAASERRPGRDRHRRPERSDGTGKAARRRTGDCLAAPAAKDCIFPPLHLE